MHFYYIDQRDCAWCKSWAFTSGKSRQKVTLERRIVRCQAKGRLCKAMSEMSTGDDGYISISGLTSFILSQPMTFAEQGEIEKLIADLNTEGDDRVTYQEFVNVMTSKCVNSHILLQYHFYYKICRLYDVLFYLCIFFFSSNTRRRISLQALLHGATFCRRMEKIYFKIDPLQPSPSEEALMQAIRASHNHQPQKSEEEPKQECKQNIGNASKWKKAKAKTVGPNADYGFEKSFTRLFTMLKNNLRNNGTQDL